MEAPSPSPAAGQGRQPVWSRGRCLSVFWWGGHPPLPQLGSSLLLALLGMTGPYVSHGFLRGRLGGGRAERAEAGILGGMPMTQRWARGHFSLTTHPGRQVPSFMYGSWLEISLPPRLPSGASLELFSPKFPREARVAMATGRPDAAPTPQTQATTAPS